MKTIKRLIIRRYIAFIVTFTVLTLLLFTQNLQNIFSASVEAAVEDPAAVTEVEQPPPNDDFDNALTVTIYDLSYSESQFTLGATTATDDPVIPCVNAQGYNSVWYKYTPEFDETVKIGASSYDFNPILAVWTGARGDLTNVACNDDYQDTSHSQVEFAALAGTTYYIEIASHHPGEYGQLFLQLNLIPGPVPNDDFDDALPIFHTPYENGQFTIGATTATDDPLIPCSGNQQRYHTVWYKYTPPVNGRIAIYTSSSDRYGLSYDTVLAVWTGARGNLTNVACNDDTEWNRQSEVELDVAAGETYYIEVASYDDEPYDYGRLWLRLYLFTDPPTNDDFATPFTITTTPYHKAQYTLGATTAADDPPIPCADGQGYHSVWYRYTPPANGYLTIDAVSNEFDVVLALWTGARGSLNNVACRSNPSSPLKVPVTAGVTYTIEVAGYAQNESGYAALWADFTPALPLNDDFANAVEITGAPYSTLQHTVGATTAADDPTLTCANGKKYNSVWYRYTPAHSGLTTINTFGANYDTVLAVWTGTRGKLASIACNDDSQGTVQSQVVFTAVSGKTYYIEVAGHHASSAGLLALSVTQENTGPLVRIPHNIPTYTGRQVVVPIYFTGGGPSIAATKFTVVYNDHCLALDPTDNNQDGIPDAITFHTPAGFNTAVTFSPHNPAAGLAFAIADSVPPLSSLPDGRLAAITFTTACRPADGDHLITAVHFNHTQPFTFTNTSGQNVSGAALDGSVTIRAGLPGDCNNDGAVNAGDIPALVPNLFRDTPGSVGCDANQDTVVNAGDLSCLALLIFHGPGACSNTAVSAATAPKLAIPQGIQAQSGKTVTVPLTFTANGHNISSLALSIDYDKTWLSFDPTDKNKDGIPDAITFNLPNAFSASAAFSNQEPNGRIDLAIFDAAAPLSSLPDGVIATVTFNVHDTPDNVEAFVRFAAKLNASFGDANGQSIPGVTQNGSVSIKPAPHVIYLPFLMKQ